MRRFILILTISLVFIFVPTVLINAEELASEQTFIAKSVPPNTNAFAYMGYKTITSRGSRQYALQQIAYTDMYGIRCVKQYYLVAMGTYYGRVGDTFKITLANGAGIW